MSSSSFAYETLAFNRKVNDALQAVQRILDIEKKPSIAGDVQHTYGAKFLLVDSLSNVAIIAYTNALEKLGLDAALLKTIDGSTPTTLRFESSTSCQFLQKKVVDVPIDRTYERTAEIKSTGLLGNVNTKRVQKVIQHVEEWHYNVETSWSVSIYSGTDVAQKKVIMSRHGSTTLITQSKDMPLPKHKDHVPIELALTFLLKQIDKTQLTSNFRVDVDDSKTKTPRRNEAIEKAIDFAKLFKAWCMNVNAFMIQQELTISNTHHPAILDAPSEVPSLSDTAIMYDKKIFNPILPLMEESSNEDIQDVDGTDIENKSVLRLQSWSSGSESRDKRFVLPPKDVTKLLNEHFNSVTKAILEVQKSFPPDKENNTVAFSEAVLSLLTVHIPNLVDNFVDSLTYIEEMMEEQLTNAIGKRISPDDLDSFVKFHNARLLSPMPQPFSHAISRPEHNPVGLVSIESSDDEHKCIHTHSRMVVNSLLKVPLNSATTVALTGKQYLHGFLNYRFEKHHQQYQLVSRARQFSAFILIIGTMTGPSTIEPKDAIIIQNKDEVIIPLLLNELPTAKEFKDAIKSLSPEQQAFAKAYRSMQLQSSVFGCAIIQIKPQLEVLLGIPKNALDKEMNLTQNLMELFTEYQVPSDLLSYNGRSEDVALEDKLANVKQNVKAVTDVIAEEKKKQMELAKAKTDMAVETTFQHYLNDGGHMMAMSALGAPVSRVAMASVRHLSKDNMLAPGAPVFKTATIGEPMEGALMERRMGRPYFTAAAAIDSPAQAPVRETQNAHEFKNETASPRDNRTYLTKSDGVDFTLLPQLLDAAVEKMDNASALRSTTIKAGQVWVRNRQENLLAVFKRQNLGSDELQQEKNKAFELLDALSRSGSLPIESSELHVIVAVTHCFEKDIIGTIIQDNINPIQKLESSTLLFASSIHGVEARDLIKDDSERRRLEGQNPLLLQNN